MTARPPVPRLTDIVEAIGHITSEMADVPLDAFERDWRRRWLVERGVEIVSEASRHLPADLKARHPDIPWQKVAGIGNVLRHNYQSVAAQVCGRWYASTCRRSTGCAARNSRPSRHARVRPDHTPPLPARHGRGMLGAWTHRTPTPSTPS